MEPQTKAVLNYMQTNKKNTITSMEAIKNLGITRLSAKIYDLRHKYSFEIIDRRIPVVTRYGTHSSIKEYKLVGHKQSFWEKLRSMMAC